MKRRPNIINSYVCSFHFRRSSKCRRRTAPKVCSGGRSKAPPFFPSLLPMFPSYPDDVLFGNDIRPVLVESSRTESILIPTSWTDRNLPLAPEEDGAWRPRNQLSEINCRRPPPTRRAAPSLSICWPGPEDNVQLAVAVSIWIKDLARPWTGACLGGMGDPKLLRRTVSIPRLLHIGRLISYNFARASGLNPVGCRARAPYGCRPDSSQCCWQYTGRNWLMRIPQFWTVPSGRRGSVPYRASMASCVTP